MRIAFAFLTLVVLFASGRANAQETSAENKETARTMARRGAVYFDNHDWEKAAEVFHRSYDIVKAPTLALMEARALTELGRLVEAGNAYARALSVKTTPDNEPYRRAQADAASELAALRRRIPILEVVARADAPASPEVRVDGARRTDFAAMPLDPGTHIVSVLTAGARERVRSVALVEGERRTMVFEPPVASGSPPDSRNEPADSPHSASNGWMWTAFGIGGAGLATGVAAGALALDRQASLSHACQDAVCPPDQETNVRDYRRLRTVSLVGYVAGFVGIAGGIVILASRPSEPSSPRVTASVSAGPSGVIVSGGF